MDNDLNDFIRQEQIKLTNIQSGLSIQQRARLSPKIAEIRYLLGFLRTSGLSKKQKEDIRDDIEEGTKIIKKMGKAEKLREAMNVAITSKIKPNRTTIPEEIRQKAILVKASGEFEKDQNKDRVNDFLEENDSQFRVSNKVDSTTEGLVLENMNDPTDVKVAFRGSKMNNAGDWASNAKFAVGLEQVNLAGEEDRVGQGRQLIRDIKAAYGQNPNEIIGHSRGSALGILIGDAEGINTTNFNPFLGRNITRGGETTARHAVWRTTDDIASLGLGFKYNQNNFDVNSVNPLKKNVNKPIGTHKLENFIKLRNRALVDDPNLLDNLLKRTVVKSATKYAESENVLKALSVKEKVKFVDRHPDKFNTQAKANANTNPLDQVGHSLNNPQLYKNQLAITDGKPPRPTIQLERSNAGLFPPQTDKEVQKMNIINKLKPPDTFDYSESTSDLNEPQIDAMLDDTIGNQDLLDEFSQDLELDIPNQQERDIDDRGIKKMKEQSELNRKRFANEQTDETFRSKIDEIRSRARQNISVPDSQNVRNKLLKEQQNRHQKWLDKQDTKFKSKIDDIRSRARQKIPVPQPATQVPDTQSPNMDDFYKEKIEKINKELKETAKEMNKLLLKKQQGETIDENELADLSASVDDFRLARQDLQDQLTGEIADTTLTDYVQTEFPEGITDGKLNSKVKSDGKLHNIWRKIDGKITDEEQQHLDANKATDDEKHNFQELDDSEIDDLQNGDSVSRNQFSDDLHEDVMEDINTVDDRLSIPNESGGDNTLTGAFKQGVSPIALSIGLISGGITDKALGAILPKNTNKDLRSGLSGGLSGGIGETASMILGSGASASLGAIGSSYGLALAPAVLSGAAGAEVGQLTAKGLQKAGADDFEISTGAGLTSGLTTGATGSLLTTAIGSTGLLGAELATPFDAETLGLASVAGAALGGTIGAGSYLGSEEYKALDTTFKDQGASKLGSSVAAGALTGATLAGTVGTVFGPAGTAVGAVAGAGIGSLIALGNYGFHKIF